MYKQYKGLSFPKINVNTLFTWDFNIIAWTLWYNSISDLLTEQGKTYNLDKHNPFQMKDMDILVERIYSHIKNDSEILVFWDFDVDWISAASVLIKWLNYLWSDKVRVLIPNREIWYSIKREYILEYINNPTNNTPDLIITVDCGIKSSGDIDFIVNQLWIEVLVTDHHGVDENVLPLSASAIVNPHRNGGSYPFTAISGSLVALKVMEALEEYIIQTTNNPAFVTWPQWNPNFVMSELQELAMLWTVADVMPINDENRWLVKDTIPRLLTSSNIGLMVFTNELRRQYTERSDLNTDFIGWQIGPRINASWRIWNPYSWLKMFMEKNVDVLRTQFWILNSVNKDRQEILKNDYLIAKESEENNPNKWIVYIEENLLDWIIWLIAWRLKEEYYKPTVAIWWRSISVDLIYPKWFTHEEEMWIYSFLFWLKEYLTNKYQTELFYWASIQNWNRIIFSVAEQFIDKIEEEFKYAFNNASSIIIDGSDEYMNTYISRIPSEDMDPYTPEQLKEEMYKAYPKLKVEYLKEVAWTLNNVNPSLFEFEYNTVLKWSCRSVEWFNITEALEYLNNEYKNSHNWEPLLLWFGWHPLAAWFWILEWKVEEFKYLFEELANNSINNEILKKELKVNMEVEDLSLINIDLVNNITSMWPYGNKNEYPRVLVKGKPIYAELLSNRWTTVKMFIEDDRWNQLELIYFRYKDNKDIEEFCNAVIWKDTSILNTKFWFVGSLDKNTYKWITKIQLKPIDLIILD